MEYVTMVTFPFQKVAINILMNGLNSDDQINGMLGNIGTALQGILEEQGGLLGFGELSEYRLFRPWLLYNAKRK